MLFSADDADNKDNSRETDPFACWQPGDTCYEWQANGMLAGVRTPDGRTVTFGYDALGRRVSKRTGDTVHRFGWDGNVVLHEWDTDEVLRPKLVTDETGREEYDGTEKPDNLVTWVYDGTSFTPVAKVTDGERYTIVHDYLGTPTQAYDSKGELVWEMLLDVYGKVTECHGDRTLVPFRYQGQYEDEETGLYYNRFRYYSPDMGMYISSDPIGLAGNNPTLYGYVQDVNTWLDIWGLCPPIWNNGWRTSDGKFATPNSTERAGEQAVIAVKEKLSNDGWTFIGEELTVVNDSGQRRRYDLVFKDSEGVLVGVEVKSNSAIKTKSQRLFDAGVTPDTPAIGVGKFRGNEITKTVTYKVSCK